jgi:hypothetical protein
MINFAMITHRNEKDEADGMIDPMILDQHEVLSVPRDFLVGCSSGETVMFLPYS